MKRRIWFVLILIYSCAPTRIIKPLEKGETTVGGTFGGAVIKLGSAPIPLPLTSLIVAHGLTPKTTLYSALHTTALAYGVLQLEIGACKEVLNFGKNLPAISIGISSHFMMDRWNKVFSIYPQLDLNGYLPYGTKKHFVYMGLNNWFEFRNYKAHQEKQELHWLPNFSIGNQWNYKTIKMQFEIKYLGFNQSNQNLVVEYVSPSSKGALGVYFGVYKSF